MFSKILSFLLYYPQLAFPECGGAKDYLSVYKKETTKNTLFDPFYTSTDNLSSIFDR